MRALQNSDIEETNGLSPAILQKRLTRERNARQEAERLLESISRELYSANEASQKAASLLEGRRAQLNAILDHTVAGIFFVRQNLSIRSANRSARTMFDLNDDMMIELTLKDIFPQAVEDPMWIEQIIGASNGLDVVAHEVVARKSDGVNFPVELDVSVLEHEGKQHFVWIVRDISRRKRDAERRAALESELSQAQKLEALGTLASGVAHEINTPIQYISDNVQFLKGALEDFGALINTCSSALSEEAHDIKDLRSNFAKQAEEFDLAFLLEETPQAISQSLHGLEQVATIVKAIKSFAHPGSDEKSVIDLNEMIETAVTVTRNQWKLVAEVEMHLAPDLPQISGYSSDVNQVLMNLIVNAVDAIEEKDKPENEKIIISTRLGSQFVEVCIEDTGCGIPEEIKQKIFDPFFTTKDVGKGSGQGLAISHSIIRQRHGGSISCESAPGVGTIFIIQLPIATDAEPKEDAQ